MKPSNFLIKLAAIVSSVLLLSGFVGYRAGAFYWLTATQEIVSDKSAEPGPTMMYSSKDGIFVDALPADATESQPSTQSNEPSGTSEKTVIMPGSKSAIVIPAASTPAPKEGDSQSAVPDQSSPPPK